MQRFNFPSSFNFFYAVITWRFTGKIWSFTSKCIAFLSTVLTGIDIGNILKFRRFLNNLLKNFIQSEENYCVISFREHQVTVRWDNSLRHNVTRQSRLRKQERSTFIGVNKRWVPLNISTLTIIVKVNLYGAFSSKYSNALYSKNYCLTSPLTE